MARIVNITDSEIIFNQGGVIGKQVLRQENTEFVYLSFEPGSETSAHIQEILMTFYISNGKGTVIIENETFQLEKGQVIEIPAGKNRQWKNSGSEVLELFVVKKISQ
ncbi:MAG: cupin domain-containing protein [Chloroflexia bacterium]|nr:cupin domain-containing protein [Chloroflexia bacterium]